MSEPITESITKDTEVVYNITKIDELGEKTTEELRVAKGSVLEKQMDDKIKKIADDAKAARKEAKEKGAKDEEVDA